MWRFKYRIKGIGFSEIDSFALRTYKSNYNTKGEIDIGDLYNFSLSKDRINKIPDFSLLTAAFLSIF